MTAPASTPSTVLVRDIMSQPVLTVEVDESLWDAWQLLFVSGLRHLVVIDKLGRSVGILSDRNILAEVPATAEHLSSRLVSDVLARVPVASIGPEADPREAANVMAHATSEAVPVLEADGRLVGIVTESDLVRWLGD
ncbi:MAG TPA: CBS domain-containing protein [Candidatus Nanopelagicales bacterium]|nr:CBS domain-containing protein [Candidatus Nanopelagicales bacterium]